MKQHHLKTLNIAVIINAHGAELSSLRDINGTELLWQAQAPWQRHAPNLFPIVGKLKDDVFHHDGQTFHMKQHGFARDMVFAWEASGDTHCRLTLCDDAATWGMYPFRFKYAIDYTVAGDTLSVTYNVENTGDVVLPASFGAHPAFIWPLLPGIAKEAHVITFDKVETAPLRRVANGLLLAEEFPNPVAGTVLALNDNLFAHDALIMDKPASKSVTYTAPNAHAITVSWDEGFNELGIWARPDADLLCIEPWHGMASPHDFDGDFVDKPGIMLIPPGTSRAATYRIRVAPPKAE